MSQIIRLMTSDDVVRVAELERMIFSDPWSENVYRQTLALDETIYLVICDSEKRENIIGVAGVRNIVGDGEITNVMVLPEYRQKGLAYRLLQELIEKGREIGITAYTLEVRASNSSAIRLYEKLGFISAGIRPGFYEHPKEDALIMWKK